MPKKQQARVRREIAYRAAAITAMAGLLLSPYYLRSDDRTYGDVVVSKVISVYDGDTFKVDIEEWPEIIGDDISVRVYGIDTPELRDPREDVRWLAKRAASRVRQLLTTADRIELTELRRGKYFRIVARVRVDGRDLSQLLVRERLAKPYFGGKKQEWTSMDVRRYRSHMRGRGSSS